MAVFVGQALAQRKRRSNTIHVPSHHPPAIDGPFPPPMMTVTSVGLPP